MPPIRKLDPEATRAAIVEAAMRLFVERGFNGVSMADIARAASVTKSLIHHHFGSKADLWEAVKAVGIQPYLDWQRQMLESRGPDETLLTDSVLWYFRFLQGRPDLVRLMVWMAIEPELCTVRDPDLIELGVLRLREGQIRGVIRADIDPRSLIIGFLGVCEHFHQYRHVMCMGPHQTPEGARAPEPDPEADAFLDTMLKVIGQGLRPPTDR